MATTSRSVTITDATLPVPPLRAYVLSQPVAVTTVGGSGTTTWTVQIGFVHLSSVTANMSLSQAQMHTLAVDAHAAMGLS